MLNTGEDAESQKLRSAYTAPVHTLLTPAAEAFFTGKMDLSKLSIFDRLISAVIKAKDEDLRDWNECVTGESWCWHEKSENAPHSHHSDWRSFTLRGRDGPVL